MKPRPVLYPFALAAFPVAALFAHNAVTIPLGQLWLPIAVVLGGTFAIWGVLTLVLRDAHKAGLLATLAVILFESAQSMAWMLACVLEYLSSFWVITKPSLPTTPCMIGESIVVGIVAILVLVKLKKPERLTPYLNVFSIILLAMPTVKIADVAIHVARKPSPVPTKPLAVLARTTKTPDVYYIVLDSFARGDVIREEFGYDLEPFYRRLEAKGFFVARKSTANYCQTQLSISSSLNARYHEESDDGEAPRELFNDNAVVKTLRPLGYRFVSFATGFDLTDLTDADDYQSAYAFIPAFHRMLIEDTPFWRFLPNPLEHDSYALARRRVLHVFDRLPAVAAVRTPTFTLAHILAPHPPFVFGPDGEDVSRHDVQYLLSDGDRYRAHYNDSSSSLYRRGYRDQVEFLVKKVERVVDEILAASAQPPIIIIQGDHGSGLRLDMEDADKTDHRERMGILNAYYFPDRNYAGLTESATPVNSFRIMLDNEFAAALPLLPEENYYSSWGKPFHFTRVTDRVGAPNPAAVEPKAGPAADDCEHK